MRILYFGGYDRGHPRNRVMMEGLRRCGAEVVECHSRHFKLFRPFLLAFQYGRLHRGADVVVVGASGHAYLPLAWLLCRLTKKRLLLDAFISHLENWQEGPWKRSLGGGLGRGWASFLDRLGANLAEVVLLDTEEHADYLRKTFGLSKAKVQPVPVGADDRLFSSPRQKFSSRFRVLFVGSFLPLHGVPVIVEAARILRGEPDLLIELIGPGGRSPQGTGSLQDLPLTFRGPIPYEEYAHLLPRVDVALGAFGTTPKAHRVVPCKVYEALAAGVPLVTGDTPAVRSILRHEQDALLVPPGSGQALAEAILRLKKDPSLRSRLGEEGRRAFQRIGTPEIVGEKLLAICRGVLNK